MKNKKGSRKGGSIPSIRCWMAVDPSKKGGGRLVESGFSIGW